MTALAKKTVQEGTSERHPTRRSLGKAEISIHVNQVHVVSFTCERTIFFKLALTRPDTIYVRVICQSTEEFHVSLIVPSVFYVCERVPELDGPPELENKVYAVTGFRGSSEITLGIYLVEPGAIIA